MKHEHWSTTKTRHTVKVTRLDLLAFLKERNPDLKIPDDAQVVIRVPGEGDYANCSLDVNEGEQAITVHWTEDRPSGLAGL